MEKQISNANILHKNKLRLMDKIALWITNKVGSMWFFIIILSWTIFWLWRNIFWPINYRFDPSPAFVFWLFISNMIQIFLMPLIMVWQNLQSRHSETRADLDYLINVKAEKQIEELSAKIDLQNKLILELSSNFKKN